MDYGFAIIDGRLLTPDELKEKRRNELRHEIGVYRKNLQASKRWLILNGWFASESKVTQVRDHINHLTATIAEKQEELNRLYTH